MKLEFSPEEEAFRAEIREWLAANVPAEPLLSMDTPEGFVQHRAWEAKLYDAKLAAVSWPARYGGRDATLIEWLIFEEEYYAAGAPARVSQNGIFLLAPTLLAHGSEDQLERFMNRIASGEQIWAQAWSEPEAGSDLASLTSKADRCDGGWLLSGQKTWCSRAAFADMAFGIFRSDRESERHHGLSYFVFPLDAPGVTVRPIGRLDGEPGFAEIFLEEVFVPDADVIGEPGAGWKVAMSTVGDERGLTLRSPGRFSAAADRLVGLAQRLEGKSDDHRRVASAWIAAHSYTLYGYEAASRIAVGEKIGFESSMNKVYWSELDLQIHELALDLLGPSGELFKPDADPSGLDRWLDGYVFALAGPIYAGANEIQRNIIAERLLGLPRGA